MKYWFLVILLIIASVTFCINKKKKNNRLATNFENTNYIDFEIDYKYLITEVEIDGVKVGDSYKFHKRRLKKTNTKNTKAPNHNFDLYNSEKEKIGLVYLDANNKKFIDKIEITSLKYKTDKGIGVGNTLKEIKESYPKSEIHGCDIEGKTIVMAGDYHFLLEDTFFYSYIIDESKIAPSTKIKMITIRN